MANNNRKKRKNELSYEEIISITSHAFTIAFVWK